MTANDGMADVWDGLSRFQLWTYLAWRDVKRANVRTRLGVLWHPITFFAVAAGISTLYAQILGQPRAIYVPYISAGLMAWNFINAPFGEGLGILIRDRGIITQVPTPLSLYVFRFVCKNAMILALNCVGYFFVLLSFGVIPRPDPLHLVMAVALLLVSASAGSALLSIATVFYSSIQSLLPSLMRLAFFVTPVLWMPNMLTGGPGTGHGVSMVTVLCNPLYHYLEVFRGSLIGYPIGLLSWVVVGTLSALLGAAAVVALSRLKPKVLVNL